MREKIKESIRAVIDVASSGCVFLTLFMVFLAILNIVMECCTGYPNALSQIFWTVVVIIASIKIMFELRRKKQ